MAKYDDRGFVIELEPGEVFIFGSNLAGEHAGGAARLAYDQFGAEWGVGEGLTGNTYAFPTLDENFHGLSYERLLQATHTLHDCINDNPDKVFILTKVGCGIAGVKEETMRQLFAHFPDNLKKPEGW